MKRSHEEQLKRLKYLNKYNGKTHKLNETIDEVAAPVDPNMEREMQAALSQIMNDLPAELSTLAKTAGNRDGQLDVAGQTPTNPTPQAPQQPVAPQTNVAETELNEAIGMLAAGAALALPAITNMVGKAAQFLGKKIDNSTLQQFGNRTKQFGDKMHHTYEHAIDVVLSPLTKNLDPAKRKMVNKLVFYSIVATFFGIGASGAIGAAGAGKAGLAAAEGGLSTVKATELVAAAKEVLPKVLAAVGLA